MRDYVRHRIRRSLAFAIVAALTFAAGSAFVALGDPAPVTFYGCLSSTGTLNSVKTSGSPKCPRGSQQVSWNQMGPAGPKGDQGPSGLSKAYSAVNNERVDLSDEHLSDSATAVVILANLPAGNYIVNASETGVSVHNADLYHRVACRLSGGTVWGTQNQSGQGYTNVSISESITLASAGDLSLLCFGSVSDPQFKVESDSASITATQVDTIN